MLKKRMATLFLAIMVVATTLLTSVPTASAATRVTPDAEAWGYTPAYYYDTVEAPFPNWSATDANKSIRVIADANGGYAMWVKATAKSNLKLGNAPVLSAGTYTLSGDVKLGGSNGYPSMLFGETNSWTAIQATTGTSYGSNDATSWGTFTHEVTVADGKTWTPTVEVSAGASTMIDNIAIKDADGVILWSESFDIVPALVPAKTTPSSEEWGFTPAYYWDTEDAPIPTWSVSDELKSVRVIPDADGGYAMWIKATGKSSIRSSALTGLPADTYTITGNVKLGGSNDYPKMMLADNITWTQWDAAGNYNSTDASSWGTFTKTITATAPWDPYFEIYSGTSTMIDNFKVTNSQGMVVFEEDFNTVPALTVAQIPATEAWGYTPAYYWDTALTPFANWSTSVDRHSVRVVQGKDSNFAMWVKNTTSDGYSVVSATGCPALSAGTYTMTADVKLGGSSRYPSTLLQETNGWTEGQAAASAVAGAQSVYSWSTATWTVTVEDGKTWTPTFKPNSNCSAMIDNFVVKNSNDEVVWADDFEDVPALSWVTLDIGNLEVDDAVTGEVTASTEVINTTPANVPMTMITCLYDGGSLVEVKSIISTIAPAKPSPAATGEVTTISATEMVTDADIGKEFKVFLWNSLTGMKYLTGAQSVTIE